MSAFRYGPELERIEALGAEAPIASVVTILAELVEVVDEQAAEIGMLRRRSCYHGPAS